MPRGRPVGTSDGAPFAAIADETRRFYGVQFHPEVVHTPDGAALLRNFTHGVAGCTGDWTMAAFRDRAIADVRAVIETDAPDDEGGSATGVGDGERRTG